MTACRALVVPGAVVGTSDLVCKRACVFLKEIGDGGDSTNVRKPIIIDNVVSNADFFFNTTTTTLETNQASDERSIQQVSSLATCHSTGVDFIKP